jgi:hypothetical protein
MFDSAATSRFKDGANEPHAMCWLKDCLFDWLASKDAMDLLSEPGKVTVISGARCQFVREGLRGGAEYHTGRCVGAGAANGVACDNGSSTAWCTTSAMIYSTFDSGPTRQKGSGRRDGELA